MGCSHDSIGYNMHMNTSLSIFAKALASENLSFSFSNKAETASFDVKSRHLVMPIWKVSETVQTMLIAHEISHALWTPYELSRTLLDAAEAEGYKIDKLQRIANMIEDVRIEKLMKQKFPGTRRDFFLGYKEINDLDLFQFNTLDLSAMTLNSRLNIHFKWGVPGFIDVKLSEQEQEIAAMVDSVVTFEQCIELAKYLYGDPDADGKKQEVKDNNKGEGLGNSSDGSQDPSFDKMMSGLASPKGSPLASTTVVIGGVKDLNRQIISTEQVLESFTIHPWLEETLDNKPDLTAYRTFVRESDAFVRQLVAQFERKKAADEIRRERPKQTGQLNLDRLHQYRTHDDIFLSKIVKKDGKNHGVIFMIDFSGSMQPTLQHAILQVLQLVWFCEKAKIPFEVFGFTDVCEQYIPNQPGYAKWRQDSPANEANTCRNSMRYGSARLITLASSRDDAAKREQLLALVYESYVLGNRMVPAPLRLSGTPTVESVAIASQFMKEWIVANNVQIPTLMVVTDGEPNGFNLVNDATDYTTYGDAGSLTVVNHVADTVTRTKIEYRDNLSNSVISTMLDSMRTKFGARIVGMFVGGNKALPTGIYNKFCIGRNENNSYMDHARYEVASEIYKSEGCILAHSECSEGYDEFFIIKTPQIVKDEDAIADSGTFTKIKNTFIRTMGKRSCSRVFLSRYVDIVSGQPLRKGADALYGKKAANA